MHLYRKFMQIKKIVFIGVSILFLGVGYWYIKPAPEIKKVSFYIEKNAVDSIALTQFYNYVRYEGTGSRQGLGLTSTITNQLCEFAILNDSTDDIKSFRIDFIPGCSDTVILSKMRLEFNNGKVHQLSASEFISYIYYKERSINVAKIDEGTVRLVFLSSEESSYIETKVLPFRRIQFMPLFVCILAVIFIWIIYFIRLNSAISLEMLFWLILTVFLYFSFFSGMMVNHWLIGIYGSLGVLRFLVDGFRWKGDVVFIFFMSMLLLERVLWLMMNYNHQSIKFVESGLGFVIFPIAFSFFCYPIDLVKKAFAVPLIVLILLLFSSAFSFLVYTDSYSYYFNTINVHLNALFHFFPNYKHPSYLMLMFVVAYIFAWESFRLHNLKFSLANGYLLLLIITFLALVGFAVFAESKAGIVMVFIAMLFPLLMLMNGRTKKYFMIITSIFLFLGVAYITSNPSFYSSIDKLRYVMHSLSWDAIAANFWIGQGTASQSLVINKEILDSYFNSMDWIDFNNPHNQFLSDLIQFGLLGAWVLPALLVYMTYRAIKNADIALLLTIFIFVFFMTNETPLERSRSQLMFIIVSSILLYSSSVRMDNEPIKQVNTKLSLLHYLGIRNWLIKIGILYRQKD